MLGSTPSPARTARAHRGGHAQAVAVLGLAITLLGLAILHATGRREDLIRSFEIMGYQTSRAPHSGRPWAVGESYLLRVSTRQAGYVVIYHVDPDGVVSLLHPDGRWAPMAANTVNMLPAPQRGIAWTFQGTPGQQFFVAASSQDPRVDALALIEEMERTCDGLSESADRQDCIVELLRRRFGPTHTIPVELRPHP